MFTSLSKYSKFVAAALVAAAVIVANHGWGQSTWWLDVLAIAGALGVRQAPGNTP